MLLVATVFSGNTVRVSKPPVGLRQASAESAKGAPMLAAERSADDIPISSPNSPESAVRAQDFIDAY